MGVEGGQNREVVADGGGRIFLFQQLVPQPHEVLFGQIAQQSVLPKPFGQMCDAVAHFLERAFARVVLRVEPFECLLDRDGLVPSDEPAVLRADALDLVLLLLGPCLCLVQCVVRRAAGDDVAILVGQFDLVKRFGPVNLSCF